VLLIDSKNVFLHFEDVSRGSLGSSVVHSREHNHSLFQAGKRLGIRLLDHIIVGENYSFADTGLIPDVGEL